MSGAYSKPMPWAGGGATKPPMANNYLDSHGLNPGNNNYTKNDDHNNNNDNNNNNSNSNDIKIFPK